MSPASLIRLSWPTPGNGVDQPAERRNNQGPERPGKQGPERRVDGGAEGQAAQRPAGS
ncbi:hypothetical protein I6A60_32265 [Frankia sp. AgB1.9]|uniref:hypothetical protein n=1 Tax=unclassified Frankia TaxID=2632575 RepID=UPI001931F214|nr:MULTISPECIES: hypothetical protein [unclassified Frankia]MBL7494279.1 hypothetical protein [Frankia sp. AgW1.1]MBL7552500.1 hypothetical protein [Frankia sp. AgB1.9]MBL7625265.1 hypothetical protein [Frankia sp. AgB1.8]